MPAYYEDLGDGRFRSDPSTAGPWGPDDQHGGPPSALLAGAMEACEPRPEMLVARVTVEILGPVKVDDLTVEVRVTRPGRRVERLEGTIEQRGRVVAAASAWRIARTTSQTRSHHHRRRSRRCATSAWHPGTSARSTGHR